MAVEITPDQIETWIAARFEYKTRRGGNEILICNPFIGDDKFKFNICLEKKESRRSGRSNYWVHDWRYSEYDGSFINFVQKHENCSYPEAVKQVTGVAVSPRAHLRMAMAKKMKDVEEAEYSIKLPDSAIPLRPKKDHKVRQIALNYLASRGISEEQAIRHRIHYDVSSLYFPYYEYDYLVYWQARDILNKRFEFPELGAGAGKSDFLYGFDQIEPGQVIFLTEAIIDAISLGEGGLAAGGAGELSKRQIKKLKALNPGIVVLAPDNDNAGRETIRSNFYLLRRKFRLEYVIPPKGYKDWNDLERGKPGSAYEYAEANRERLDPPTLFML